MNGRVVIVAYRPHVGKEERLLELVQGHVPELRRLNLAADRTPVIMRAGDGTIIEVFEWASAEAIERAHQHPAVHTMWAAFEAVCDYVSLADLDECKGLFAEFTPL